MDTIQLITEISVLKKKMDKAEAFLEELVEYLLVTCKDDDYITPEVICRKLAKYGYIELEDGYWVNPLADRKTESNSEKPNNSTISKMEQVDKLQTKDYCDICNHKGCEYCISDSRNPYCIPGNYEPRTEGNE